MLDANGNIHVIARGADLHLYSNRFAFGSSADWLGWNALPRLLTASSQSFSLLTDGRAQVAVTEFGTGKLQYVSDLRSWN